MLILLQARQVEKQQLKTNTLNNLHYGDRRTSDMFNDKNQTTSEDKSEMILSSEMHDSRKKEKIRVHEGSCVHSQDEVPHRDGYMTWPFILQNMRGSMAAIRILIYGWSTPMSSQAKIQILLNLYNIFNPQSALFVLQGSTLGYYSYIYNQIGIRKQPKKKDRRVKFDLSSFCFSIFYLQKQNILTKLLEMNAVFGVKVTPNYQNSTSANKYYPSSMNQLNKNQYKILNHQTFLLELQQIYNIQPLYSVYFQVTMPAPISQFLRGIIVALRYSKKTLQETQQTIEEMGYTASLATITRVFTQWENDDNAIPQKPHGRPAIYDEDEKERWVNIFKSNPGLSVKQFVKNEEYNFKNASEKTVRTALHESDLFPYKIPTNQNDIEDEDQLYEFVEEQFYNNQEIQVSIQKSYETMYERIQKVIENNGGYIII
ncbi:hypothetical protein ABPG72_002097 [Tetrahymena utriculariae]